MKTCVFCHGKPYLARRDSIGRPFVCVDLSLCPSWYLRIVVNKFLYRPEHADWHMMDTELYRRLWEEAVLRLKPSFESSGGKV